MIKAAVVVPVAGRRRRAVRLKRRQLKGRQTLPF
jgi:hypothetical protein